MGVLYYQALLFDKKTPMVGFPKRDAMRVLHACMHPIELSFSQINLLCDGNASSLIYIGTHRLPVLAFFIFLSSFIRIFFWIPFLFNPPSPFTYLHSQP